MIYTEKTFFLCRIPLSAEGMQDVEVLTKAVNIEDFPRVFSDYEEKRAHAFNDDGLFSVIRADELFTIVRTSSEKMAREMAFDESRSYLITNLQHRVMQGKDAEAAAILRKVHEVETSI
ncbi:MAG: hypothetical protein LAT75_09460 [Candidatus Cyclonatronum sp.]|uniref:hypothetical protein n=1 Tax=Cyclonatronum sp. TaxID=3024185 RepID=UPI0025BADFED|nr:hypothetical protein [Cyclonatronum sp.]MCC5934320.1 hypothetical protein [Balneolales bacterium]MCH8487084.1 hypothetical protein [Cyclonatronum sp.]